MTEGGSTGNEKGWLQGAFGQEARASKPRASRRMANSGKIPQTKQITDSQQYMSKQKNGKQWEDCLEKTDDTDSAQRGRTARRTLFVRGRETEDADLLWGRDAAQKRVARPRKRNHRRSTTTTKRMQRGGKQLAVHLRRSPESDDDGIAERSHKARKHR